MLSSARKVVASVFWDAKENVFIDYLQKGQTINGEYFANFLRQQRKAIKSKRPGKLRKETLLQQINASAHMSVVAMAAEYDGGSQLVDLPPHTLIWHHPTIFSFPACKNTWLGSSIEPMMSFLLLRDYLRIKTRASILQGSTSCNTVGRNGSTGGRN